MSECHFMYWGGVFLMLSAATISSIVYGYGYENGRKRNDEDRRPSRETK